jgi:hypothetical protein
MNGIGFDDHSFSSLAESIPLQLQSSIQLLELVVSARQNAMLTSFMRSLADSPTLEEFHMNMSPTNDSVTEGLD